ncbi:ABC transporter ATP-binding protein [Vibrio sp. 10N.286.49.C2]|uniref:type I secretion system permease/ATPase n=1 Tax=unclassified Vibrio TaxID=2614977 RepID=UPI000C84FBDF|nr:MULTISPECIES: type I secretion system permease/ATPase [unclassified Vibrio]PMH31536.1 ABC transporter ATP-binding protein [Vibrio sp. 10N.286.49.C2]PMH50557.1 ABC transporter ATP-binding protein [Vibrio sp. 10N.286.49.B1]PMH77962.1 ABC transporter ATP-binding protein [Vibrio sp. 10N.286.48.B7]
MDRIQSAFKQTRKELWVVCYFSFVINFLVLSLPIYGLQLFDRVLSSSSLETMFALMGIALFLVTAQFLMEYIRTELLQKSGLKLDASLSGILLAKSISQSSVTNRIEKQGLQDLSEIRNFLVTPSTSAIFDLPWVPIFLIILFMLHPYIGVVALMGCVIFMLLAVVMMLQSRQANEDSGKYSNRTNMELNDYLRNAPMIKAMGMSENIGRVWETKSEKLLGYQWEVNSRIGRLLSVSRYVRTILQISVLSLGVYLVLTQQLGTGAIIASSIIMGRVLSPFEQAVSGWKSWYSAMGAWKRLNAYDESKEVKKTTLPKPKGHIQFKNVALKLPTMKEPLLQNINFKLGNGQSLAILGNSGSGKSTLAKLIMGIYQPSVGMIEVDGAAIEQWSESQFGQHIGYLPQHVGLLSGSVRDNICRFSEAKDEDVVAAAKLACIHELIISLPDGYQTYCGEGGLQLSGGQMQRIGLARAIFSNPKVLVLDEPNSNLDPEGEVALAIVLQHCKENEITTVMISHRPGFLRQMDWVILLKDGKVEKAGKSDQFLGLHSDVDNVTSTSNPQTRTAS